MAGEPERCFPNWPNPVLEKRCKPFRGAGHAEIAAGRVFQGSEHKMRGIVVEAAGGELRPEALHLGHMACLANQGEPWTGSVTWNHAALQQVSEGFSGLLGFDGGEGEVELCLMVIWGPLTLEHGGHPWLAEFTDGEPERVVEVRVHRGVENPEHGRGGFR